MPIVAEARRLSFAAIVALGPHDSTCFAQDDWVWRTGRGAMPVVFACGCCKTPVRAMADPKLEIILACPTCGLADSLDNIEREVAEFLQEDLAKAFDDMRRGVAGGGCAFTFDETPHTSRVHRFIAIAPVP
jgi:hypothetical protein